MNAPNAAERELAAKSFFMSLLLADAGNDGGRFQPDYPRPRARQRMS
jgi:hypothetical protein